MLRTALRLWAAGAVCGSPGSLPSAAVKEGHPWRREEAEPDGALAAVRVPPQRDHGGDAFTAERPWAVDQGRARLSAHSR